MSEREPVGRGLGLLAINRGHLGYILMQAHSHRALSFKISRENISHSALGKAINSVRNANTIDLIPLCLFARAAFRRSVGDWDGAARDLDEVAEIAEPGPMRLYLCDMALERARL